MFGYIRPYSADLKMKEYEFYRGVYCGLCRALGRQTGLRSRLTLNYDVLYLILVRMAVFPEERTFRRRRCLVHPAKKRPSLESCRALDYCAYVCAALAADKIEDDARDSRGFKRIGKQCLRPYGRYLAKRSSALRMYADLDDSMRKLRECEETACPSVDQPADAFGETLALLCAGDTGEADSSEYRICADIGRHLGRFIYILDAADDIAEDVKQNNYNPIAAAYGVTELDEHLKTDLYQSLLLECRALAESVALLDFSSCRNAEAVLINITTLGMPDAVARVLGIPADGEEKE